MTWIYFALWDNLTYFTNSYPLIRIAGYIGIFMKNYDDTNKSNEIKTRPIAYRFL